ncbi:hypothetical protein [Candidatus Clostridium stratigraminis]|uniref:Uncharacterized protein n=1 Tax=Candidatus Clostridium stratigraminis TaxID=3381661 RepID=A0ABW8T8L8_9CLOT
MENLRQRFRFFLDNKVQHYKVKTDARLDRKRVDEIAAVTVDAAKDPYERFGIRLIGYMLLEAFNYQIKWLKKEM